MDQKYIDPVMVRKSLLKRPPIPSKMEQQLTIFIPPAAGPYLKVTRKNTVPNPQTKP